MISGVWTFLAEKLTKSPKLHPLPNSEEVCIIGDKNRTLLAGGICIKEYLNLKQYHCHIRIS